jgi:transposase-like protein
MGISRQTARKWWRRYQEAGMAGLEDRSSRPRRCPSKTSPKVERRVVALRRRDQVGPARLASRVGIPASTLHRILQRHGVSRLSDLDRKGGRVDQAHRDLLPGASSSTLTSKQAKRSLPAGRWYSKNFAAELVKDAIKHTFTKPYKPQTNGRVERFKRTCSTNGPTPGLTAQRCPAPEPLTRGCTSTPITDTTPPLAAHKSRQQRQWAEQLAIRPCACRWAPTSR